MTLLHTKILDLPNLRDFLFSEKRGGSQYNGSCLNTPGQCCSREASPFVFFGATSSSGFYCRNYGK